MRKTRWEKYKVRHIITLLFFLVSPLQARQEIIQDDDDFYLSIQKHCLSGIATFDKNNLMTKKTYYQCNFFSTKGFLAKSFTISIDEYGQEGKHTYLGLKFPEEDWYVSGILTAEKFEEGNYYNLVYPENFKVAKRTCKETYNGQEIMCESYNKKGKKIKNPYDEAVDSWVIPLRDKELARKGAEAKEKKKEADEQLCTCIRNFNLNDDDFKKSSCFSNWLVSNSNMYPSDDIILSAIDKLCPTERVKYTEILNLLQNN